MQEQLPKMRSGRFREPLNRTFRQRSFPFDGFLFTCVTLLALQVHARAQLLMKPQSQLTTLTGTIRRAFGPSGYSGYAPHDERLSYWALDVPVPVELPCNPEERKFADTDCQPARRIQLFTDGGIVLMKLDQPPFAKWSGQKVLVRGKLYRSDQIAAKTPIFMVVKNISAAPSHRSDPIDHQRD